MTAINPAALRALAQALPVVPSISDATEGCRAIDRQADTWTALEDGWYSPEHNELSNTELEDRGAGISHVPVTVENLEAIREALNGAAAELERAAEAWDLAQRGESR